MAKLTFVDIQTAVKMIERDGVEAYHTVRDRFGEEIALALVIAHVRRLLKSDSTYPADPDIDNRVVEILAEAGIVHPGR